MKLLQVMISKGGKYLVRRYFFLLLVLFIYYKDPIE